MIILKLILFSAVNAHRIIKRLLHAAFDSVIIFLVLGIAITTRTESLYFLSTLDFYLAFFMTSVPTILVFISFGLYRAFLRYVSTEVALIIGISVSISASILLSTIAIFDLAIPLSVPVIYAAFLLIAISGTRYAIRSLLRRAIGGKQDNIAIYGAGAAGAQIFQTLKAGTNSRVRLVIDDNSKIQGKTFFGQCIYSFDDAISQFKILKIDTVLLTMPSASQVQRQTIIQKLADIGVKVQTVPSLSVLTGGSAKITELTNVAIEDLLGRQPVEPDLKLMSTAINNKSILVTGAGGSIGSELCKQIINWRPKRLIILDQSEHSIYKLERELAADAKDLDIQLTPVVTSMLERTFISQTLASFGINTIYHAAAYKHVPLMERNIMPGLKNNVFGTLTMAECAVAAGVKDFILVSTDKAVNPTNFMGISKRLCELLCQSFSKTQNKTCFSIVRFGNVLGSSGSVIPLFKKQIECGGPVTITHKDIIRYFMTIPEAAQLVIQAGALAKGGEFFVLDMGEPVRIVDLAKKMIQLTGLVPYFENSDKKGDIALKLTGLRPGEKMYEELTYGVELIATEHSRILRAKERVVVPYELEIALAKIKQAINKNDDKQICQIFNSLPFEDTDNILQKEDLIGGVISNGELPKLEKNI